MHLSCVMISLVCVHRESFSPIVSFQTLCHGNKFSPTLLCALVSPRLHLLIDYTYWQIESVCTCLVD